MHLMQPVSVPRRPSWTGPMARPPTFSTSDTTQFKRAIDMTDDELAAIASGARLHVLK